MYNIYIEDLEGNRLVNLGLDSDEGFCKSEVERLNAENQNKQLVYNYEEV